MNRSITFKGIDFDVEFDYQPEEPMVMYYADGSGHPGCAAEVSITDIKITGTDIDAFELLEDNFEKIEDDIIEYLAGEY